MSKKTTDLDKATDKRKQLENELRAIEEKLGHSVTKIKEDVENKISPSYWIRKYPQYALGVAAAVGFWIAPSRRKKRNRRQRNAGSNGERRVEQPVSVYKEPGIGVMLITELKRMATRKATDYMLTKIEDVIDKNIRDKDKEEK